MSRNRIFWVGACTAVLLLCLLTTPRDLHSVDEVALHTTAVNLLHHGRLSINELAHTLWAIRPGEAVTMLSSDGHIYTKKSPVVIPLLLPFLVLSQFSDALTLTRTALLLGPVVVVGVVFLFYRLGWGLGYEPQLTAGLIVAGIFSSLLWPYSHTIFGEPVAAFFLLLGVAFYYFHYTKSSSIYAFLSGLGFALAGGANAVYAGLGAIIGLHWAWTYQHKLRSAVLPFALPAVLVGVGLLGYNLVRFGTVLETGYNFAPGQEGFTTPLWWSVPALLISPARGLLWYAPLLWLVPFAIRPAVRRHRRLTLLILGITAFHFIAFGLWWEWWGGYAWGPRFLLPVIPLLLLLLLPLLQESRAARWAAVPLFLLGFAVNLGGVAVDYNRYEQYLDQVAPAPADQPLRYHHHPDLVYEIGRSPIVAHWQALTAGQTQPFWWQDAPPADEIAAHIRAHQRPSDLVLSLDDRLLQQWLHHPDLPPVYGLPVNVPVDDALARQLFTLVRERGRRIWLVTWYPAGDSGNWYEEELRRNWASVREDWVQERRVVLLSEPLGGAATTPGGDGVSFADAFFLVRYTKSTDREQLQISLQWQASSPPTADLVAFVHLYKNGQLVAQQDRAPLGGYRLQSNTFTDRFAFPLPPDADPAEYELFVGWYRWPSLERLPVTADGRPQPDDQYRLE